MIAGTADLLRYQGLDPRIPADTACRTPSFLLIGPHGSQVRVSASAHRLLCLALRHESAAGLTCELAAASRQPIQQEEVAAKLEEVLSILRDAELRAARNALPRGFWLRIRLASSAVVARACRPLTWLFHPAAAVFVLAGIAAAIAAFFHRSPSTAPAGQSFWSAYALFFLSLLLHELGHAAACLRFGAQPAEIGFTFYLLFPALYSDVSSAWRLRRWQREVVDLGGAYFQCAVGALYVAAFLAGAGEMFRSAFLMILYTNLFSLNPIFRFDGYWLLADALGVTNLSRQPARIARWAVARLFRRPTLTLPWAPWVVVVLAVYTLLSFSVWTVFLVRLLPWLVHQLASLPYQVTVLGRLLVRGDAAAAWSILSTLVPAIGIAAVAVAAVVGRLTPLHRAQRRRPAQIDDAPSRAVLAE